MDGVLCDSEQFITEAAQRLFREAYGLDVPAEEFLPFTGTGEDRYLGGVAEQHGIRLDPQRSKAALYATYLVAIKGRLRPTPGLRAFLDLCISRGLPMAVATSADLIKLRGNFAELDLDEGSFAATVTGMDVTRRKPAPDVFVLAAARIGCDPTSCLVVEDAITGVEAAVAAGARCLALTTSFAAHELVDAGADWISQTFLDIPASLLDRLADHT